MKTEELKIETYKSRIDEACSRKEDITFFSIIPKNLVYKGEGNIDVEKARIYGYEVYISKDVGGGIVATKGDVVLAIIKKEGWDIGRIICEKIEEFLLSKNLSVYYNNNDILVENNYKVASYSSKDIGDRTVYTGIQISFSTHPEIVKEICLKDSVKIPGGLDLYHIDQKELLDYLLNYCETL